MQMISIAAAATILAGSLCAADAGLLKLVMPDARIMAGVNVEQAMLSPFGKYLMTKMQAGDSGPMQMLQGTGFDPRRDLREILLASDAKQGNSGLVLARGAFNVSAILEAGRLQGARIGSYGGAQTLSGKDPDGLLAFPDATLAIMGDRASVHAAIDRASGTVGLAADLADRVRDLSSTEDVWFVTLNSPAQLPLGPAATVLKKAQQASGGLKFGATVTLNLKLTAESEKDATSLANVFKMVVGMMQSAAQKSSEPSPAAAMLRDLVATSDGNVTKISLSVPEDKLEAALK